MRTAAFRRSSEYIDRSSTFDQRKICYRIQWFHFLRYTTVYAALNGHEACARALNAANANACVAAEYGRTALMEAACYGHEACVRALAKRGDFATFVDMVDVDGYTALMHAARQGRTACASILIERGADVNVADADGHTAQMLAENNGFTDMMDQQWFLDRIKKRAAIVIQKNFRMWAVATRMSNPYHPWGKARVMAVWKNMRFSKK